MKKFFLVFTALLFSSTSLFAEYKLEPVHCTEKKNLIVELIFITPTLEQLIFATQKNAKK